MSENAEKKQTVEANTSVEPSAKKPYSPPKFRHLGSVRALTLGSGVTTTDLPAAGFHD